MALLVIAAIEWASIGWFQPPFMIGAVTVAMGIVLLLFWVVLLIRSAAFLQFYYQMPDKADKENVEKLKLLEEDLDGFDFGQGVDQLRMLRQKRDSLKEVLKRRLNAGELTYGRYLETAQQVYLSAVDNLHDAAVALQSVSTIDPTYIDDRIGELRKAHDASDEREREIATLEQRKSLRDQQLKRVADLVAQNESAMTVLDNCAAALADTRTGKGRASMDAEAAIAELEMLAERAGKYAARGHAES